MTDLARLQAILDPLFPGLMGVRLLEASADRVLAELTVRPELCTTGGILHGGAYMAFADTLGAVGTFMTLPAGKITTTTDSSTKFTAGARAGSTIRAWRCTAAAPRRSGRPRSATRPASCARW